MNKQNIINNDKFKITHKNKKLKNTGKNTEHI